MCPEESRYDHGLARMRGIFGSHVDATLKDLAATSPDLARYLIEFPFGVGPFLSWSAGKAGQSIQDWSHASPCSAQTLSLQRSIVPPSRTTARCGANR
jgi:hypothetical protein